MVEYPKIETLFDRDSRFKVIEGKYRLPEFELIPKWDTFEKIDGMNIRVMIGPLDTNWEEPVLERDLHKPMRFFSGRIDRSDIPKHLLAHLKETYTIDNLLDALAKAKGTQGVVLYTEGYGAKIQKGDNYCGRKVSTRLFDVLVLDLNAPSPYTPDEAMQSASGWWLEQDQVSSIAKKLDIETVPFIGTMSVSQIVEFVKSEPVSIVSNIEGGNPEYEMEGIVARTNPLLLRRNGERLMFKLKSRDF